MTDSREKRRDQPPEPPASESAEVDDDRAPGTGIHGDETIVRDRDDGSSPGIYPDASDDKSA